MPVGGSNFAGVVQLDRHTTSRELRSASSPVSSNLTPGTTLLPLMVELLDTSVLEAEAKL